VQKRTLPAAGRQKSTPPSADCLSFLCYCGFGIWNAIVPPYTNIVVPNSGIVIEALIRKLLMICFLPFLLSKNNHLCFNIVSVVITLTCLKIK